MLAPIAGVSFATALCLAGHAGAVAGQPCYNYPLFIFRPGVRGRAVRLSRPGHQHHRLVGEFRSGNRRAANRQSVRVRTAVRCTVTRRPTIGLRHPHRLGAGTVIYQKAAAAFIVFFVAAGMPSAAADPTNDGYDNIYGLLTPDEKQEIPASGHATCVALDQAHEASPPLSARGVVGVIEGFRAQGWDLESASDIVWEQVEARCPEYLDAVKRAVRTYGDPS